MSNGNEHTNNQTICQVLDIKNAYKHAADCDEHRNQDEDANEPCILCFPAGLRIKANSFSVKFIDNLQIFEIKLVYDCFWPESANSNRYLVREHE